MSRLGLGTSQTLNSCICYVKRKSLTRISWTIIRRQIWQQAQLQLHCYSENKPNITCQTRINYLKLIRVTELGSASNKKTKNAFPLQAWTGPSGSTRLRLPEFLTISTLRVQGSQIYAPAIFTSSPLFCWGWVDARAIVRSEGFSEKTITMITYGIEPETSRLVAQCFHQQCHCVLDMEGSCEYIE
jgi:hypothetical protein